ncbi:MAG: phosphoethanolamine transferase, partial [Rickettsiales bacterium]|nr:phosphoethanolamine transferase [Rickettsiales bacterium]
MATSITKMLKSFFCTKINLSQTLLCLALATIITIFCNFSLIDYKLAAAISGGFDGTKITIWSLEIALNYFLVFSFLYCCSFNKFILAIFTITFLILSLIASYTLIEFKIVIDQMVIANTLDNITNFNDIINIKTAIIYFSLFLVLPLIFLTKIRITKDKNRKIFYFITIIFLVFAIILTAFNHQNRKGIVFAYPPAGLLKSYFGYYTEIYTSLKNKPNLLPINDIIKTKISQHKIKNLKVVLIIGESARSKNFSINGYERDTTPQIKKIHNLLSFKDVDPCKNLTVYSVDCMLSYKSGKDFKFPPQEESIIKIFEKLKFSTAFFSTQKSFGDDNGLILLASEAQQFHFNDTIANKIGSHMVYDEYLLSDLKQDLAKAGDSFIILHTQGSHFLFDDRYTENFKIFTPTCGEKDLTK